MFYRGVLHGCISKSVSQKVTNFHFPLFPYPFLCRFAKPHSLFLCLFAAVDSPFLGEISFLAGVEMGLVSCDALGLP